MAYKDPTLRKKLDNERKEQVSSYMESMCEGEPMVIQLTHCLHPVPAGVENMFVEGNTPIKDRDPNVVYVSEREAGEVMGKCKLYTYSAPVWQPTYSVLGFVAKFAKLGARLVMYPRWDFDNLYSNFKGSVLNELMKKKPGYLIQQLGVRLPNYTESFYSNVESVLGHFDISFKENRGIFFLEFKLKERLNVRPQVLDHEKHKIAHADYHLKTHAHLADLAKGHETVIELASGPSPPPKPSNVKRYICIDLRTPTEETLAREDKGELEYITANLNDDIVIPHCEMFICANICSGDPTFDVLNFFVSKAPRKATLYVLMTSSWDEYYLCFKELRPVYESLMKDDPVKLMLTVNASIPEYSNRFIDKRTSILNQCNIGFIPLPDINRVVISFTKL